MPINRRHRPASQPHSLSHPHARARSPVDAIACATIAARAPPTRLRQPLRPLPPLSLHLPLPPNLVELEAGEARRTRKDADRILNREEKVLDGV